METFWDLYFTVFSLVVYLFFNNSGEKFAINKKSATFALAIAKGSLAQLV